MNRFLFQRLLFAVFVSICCTLVNAQQKGASAVTGSQQERDALLSSADGQKTYAIVIGISDYQSPEIPDLSYAHKDAEAFVEFLRSPAGGSLGEDQVKVLLNEAATTANFAAALDWLMEVTGEGDQAVIYFSGHGDVETKTMFQLGYLLTWDSPARSYVAGAFPLQYLQAVVSTLTIEKNVNLLLITDACRSGKLAGEEIGGSQLTTANLSKQFANEMKILSCQPNEFSIEGEQWGGGRGAFSYHLVQGLYGLADRNGDQWVNLMEIGRYLEDHVMKEVAPNNQLPMTIGNRSLKITKVDEKMLSKIKGDKSETPDVMNAVAMRGSVQKILEQASPSVRSRYEAFEEAIARKTFLQPPGTCANDLYLELIHEPSIEPLHSTLTRNFAKALQNDAQQTLNAWLNSDIEEVVQSGARKIEKYRHYPALLSRAAELLGESHYLYPTLEARRHLFEGYLTFLENPNNPDEKRSRMALRSYRKSLTLQPKSAHTWLFMSMVYSNNLLEPDSAFYCAMEAASIAPSWLLPYTNLAFVFSNKFQRYDEARKLLNKAMEIDPESALVWNYLGTWHAFQKEYDEAKRCYQKAIERDASMTPAYNNFCFACIETKDYEKAREMCQSALLLDSTYALAYNNLGRIYLHAGQLDMATQMFRNTILVDSAYAFSYLNLGLIYYWKGQLKEAEQYYQKAIALDLSSAIAHDHIGNVYRRQGRYTEAEASYREAIRLNPSYAPAYNNLGITYYLQENLAHSIEAFLNVVKYDPDDPIAPYSLACLYSLQKDADKSLEWLKYSLEKGYDDYKGLLQDEDLEFVRNTEGFEKLKKAHFPEKR